MYQIYYILPAFILQVVFFLASKCSIFFDFTNKKINN